MPGRITPLATGEYYHIYNRGSEKRNIYTQQRDYARFLKVIFYYQFMGPRPSFSKFSKSEIILLKPLSQEKIIEVICYCLMPNHFHFLIRQLKENGISKFMSQISNSFTKYFNTKYNRVGPLFQGAFKAVLIESDEQLIHVSRYIHLNPIVSGLVKNLEDYRWSSYLECIKPIDTFCSTNEILGFFTPDERKRYKEFVEAQIDYGRKLEKIKHQLIDIDEEH
ncbi:transposase [Candidatus Daviesbacteria bacterium]|nr:transposase [Candidatus Daviesbacteria bacterium]